MLLSKIFTAAKVLINNRYSVTLSVYGVVLTKDKQRAAVKHRVTLCYKYCSFPSHTNTVQLCNSTLLKIKGLL